MHTELNTLEDLYYSLLNKFSPDYKSNGAKRFDLELIGLEFVMEKENEGFFSIATLNEQPLCGRPWKKEMSLIVEFDGYKFYKSGSLIDHRFCDADVILKDLSLKNVLDLFTSNNNLF